MVSEKVSFSLPHLKTLLASDTACVKCESNVKRSLMLLPVYLNNLKQSVGDILASKVTTYDIELGGIILSHKNVKISNAVEMNDEGHFRLDYIADIYIFTPQIGSILTGRINKKGKDVLGCLVHSIFNVALPRPRSDDSPKKWLGSKAYLGQTVTFSVVKLDFTGRLPYIRGQLLSLECDTADDEGADSGMGIPESNEEDNSIKEIIEVDSPDINNVSLLKRKRKMSDHSPSSEISKAKKPKIINVNSSDEGLSGDESIHKSNKKSVGKVSENIESPKLKKKKSKSSIASTSFDSIENITSSLLSEAIKNSQDTLDSSLVKKIKQEVLSDSNKSNEEMDSHKETKKKKKHSHKTMEEENSFSLPDGNSTKEADISFGKEKKKNKRVEDTLNLSTEHADTVPTEEKKKKKHKHKQHDNDMDELSSRLLQDALKRMPIKVEDIKQEEKEDSKKGATSSVNNEKSKKKKSIDQDTVTKKLLQQTLFSFQKKSSGSDENMSEHVKKKKK